MSIESMIPPNHLIFCHPLLLLPSVFPSSRVFSNELALLIRWLKYWRFSFSPSNEYSGLVSFRINCFDLLVCLSFYFLSQKLTFYLSIQHINRCMFVGFVWFFFSILPKQTLGTMWTSPWYSRWNEYQEITLVFTLGHSSHSTMFVELIETMMDACISEGMNALPVSTTISDHKLDGQRCSGFLLHVR